MAHPDRTVMRAARMRLALLLAAMLMPSTSATAQGGDKDADTKVVAKGFKVEVNGEFLPVRSFSGGDPGIEKGNGKTTYTVPAATHGEDPEFHRLAEQVTGGRPSKHRRTAIRVIEPGHIATDCWATWSEQDGRRVLVITCNKREARRPRR